MITLLTTTTTTEFETFKRITFSGKRLFNYFLRKIFTELRGGGRQLFMKMLNNNNKYQDEDQRNENQNDNHFYLWYLFDQK